MRFDCFGYHGSIAAIRPRKQIVFLQVYASNPITNLLNCFKALQVGAFSRLASTCVQKLIGNWLYLKKGDGMCQIETDGKRMNLNLAAVMDLRLSGTDFFLKRGGLYDGTELINYWTLIAHLQIFLLLVQFCRI